MKKTEWIVLMKLEMANSNSKKEAESMRDKFIKLFNRFEMKTGRRLDKYAFELVCKEVLQNENE
jgi:hypothetical protein